MLFVIDMGNYVRNSVSIPEAFARLRDASGPFRFVFRGPAERWVDAVRQTVTGFDATQHFFANHSAEVDGDRAVDTRYMQARHQLGATHYTIGGYYTGDMVRTPQGWRIASYKLTVTFSDGDRRLMGIAYRKTTSAV